MKNITITPKKISRFLINIVLVLLAVHLFATLFIRHGLGYHSAWEFVPTFDFNQEKNFPAFYSSAVILLCAYILWKISNLVNEKAQSNSIYWKGMSIIFIFLALDEFYSIHEEIGRLADGVFEYGAAGGFLTHGMTFVYLIIFGLISLLFVRFFFRLPKKTRIQFVVAGVVFVFGAVVMEIIGGKYLFETDGEEDIIYTFLYTIEESLEMYGMILFVAALTRYYLYSLGTNELTLNFNIVQDKEYLPIETTSKEESVMA